jgi:hypothetical protein
LPWSERDGYARLDGYFDLAPERFRQPFIVLDHALHDEADDLIDVPQRFFAGATPSGGAPLMQGRAVRVPAVFVRLNDNLKV